MSYKEYDIRSLACEYGLSTSYMKQKLDKDPAFQFIKKLGPRLYWTDPVNSGGPHVKSWKQDRVDARREHGRIHGSRNLIRF